MIGSWCTQLQYYAVNVLFDLHQVPVSFIGQYNGREILPINSSFGDHEPSEQDKNLTLYVSNGNTGMVVMS